MNKRKIKFNHSGNKKVPVNLYYINLQPIPTFHINSRNFTGRTNTDTNVSNNIKKSKKWDFSQILDIKKNLALKKTITLMNKQKKKIISTINRIHISNNNTDVKINRNNLNNTFRNNKLLVSHKNSKKKTTNNSLNYSNKGYTVKKKINFSNISNNSFKVNEPKKIKIKNTIPFNINKININIINNNNINIIKTIKTEGNIINKDSQSKKRRRKNFTLDKLPHFEEIMKEKSIKENKTLHNKNNKDKKIILSKKKIKINSSLTNRLNKIITNQNDISLISKNMKKKLKQNKRNILNEKSMEHKKIIPINYFQDYKKKNNSLNKKIKKEFINYNKFIKIKNKENQRKKLITKNNTNFLFKQKRPYSKEEKSKNIIKIKEKSKHKLIKQKILKIVAKKSNLLEQILFKKINNNHNSNRIKIISKSEIRNRRAKSNNNKSNAEDSQKINMENESKILDKINNENECDINDILQDNKIPNGEIDNFDDIYSIVKVLNFDTIKKDSIFCVDDSNNYLLYKEKFDKIWNKNLNII